jgi:hypothetical protein
VILPGQNPVQEGKGDGKESFEKLQRDEMGRGGNSRIPASKTTEIIVTE